MSFWCQGGLDARPISLVSDWISCPCITQSSGVNPSPSSVHWTAQVIIGCCLGTVSSPQPWQSVRADYTNICQEGCKFSIWWGLMAHRVLPTIWLWMLPVVFLSFLGSSQEVAITRAILLPDLHHPFSEQADRNALSAVAALTAAGKTPARSLPSEKVPGAGCGQLNSPGGLHLLFMWDEFGIPDVDASGPLQVIH